MRHLDRAKVEYGMSITTMEEVFLRASDTGSPNDMQTTSKLAKTLSSRTSTKNVEIDVASESMLPHGRIHTISYTRQFAALLKKRFLSQDATGAIFSKHGSTNPCNHGGNLRFEV